MGRPGGWAKNWAGVRVIAVPVHLAWEKKAWSPCPRALLVKVSCPCGNSSKAALFAFEINSEELQGKVVSSPFSSSLHFQALVALCC